MHAGAEERDVPTPHRAHYYQKENVSCHFGSGSAPKVLVWHFHPFILPNEDSFGRAIFRSTDINAVVTNAYGPRREYVKLPSHSSIGKSEHYQSIIE